MRLTYISRFAVKFIEVAGPGLASALCAYFLGQIERSPAPAPATAVVQISPATIENAAREAGVAVAAQNAGHAARACEHRARHALGAETREVCIYRTGTPQGEVRTGGRERAEPKARAGEPLAIDAAAISSTSAPKTTGQSIPTTAGRDEPAAWSSEEERPLLAKLIPSWFLPENDRIFGDMPRPPMPVGESLRSAM